MGAGWGVARFLGRSSKNPREAPARQRSLLPVHIADRRREFPTPFKRPTGRKNCANEGRPYLRSGHRRRARGNGGRKASISGRPYGRRCLPAESRKDRPFARNRGYACRISDSISTQFRGYRLGNSPPPSPPPYSSEIQISMSTSRKWRPVVRDFRRALPISRPPIDSPDGPHFEDNRGVR